MKNQIIVFILLTMSLCQGQEDENKIPKQYFEALNYIKSCVYFRTDSVAKGYFNLDEYLIKSKNSPVNFIVSDSTIKIDFKKTLRIISRSVCSPVHLNDSIVNKTSLHSLTIQTKEQKPNFIVFFSQISGNLLLAEMFFWLDSNNKNVQLTRGDFHQQYYQYTSFNESLIFLFCWKENSEKPIVSITRVAYD